MDHETRHLETMPGLQVETDQYCVGCSYNLRGLAVEGKCPECGAAVERSLRGDLLEYSSPDYLASLSRGLHFVVTCTIIQLVAMLIFVVVGFALVFGGPANSQWFGAASLEILLSWTNAGLMALIVYGWYLFSTPDPAIAGSDRGDMPRRVVRVTAIISLALTLAAAVVSMVPTGSVDPNVSVAQEVLAATADSLAGIATIVLYFASLVYVRWIARRVPNQALDFEAKRLMWLGPLVYILLACIIIGPIIAIVLYLKLLMETRQNIDRIREMQAPLYPN